MKFDKIIVSKKAFENKDSYDIINSNITVINVLGDEGVDQNDMHEDAITSYYVDFYLAQCNNGGFPQFVYNTRWNDALNDIIEKGLQMMEAKKHLEYFINQSKNIEKISKEELDSFFESDFFGTNETRDKLKDDSFFSLEENLIELNSKWLKNHPDLVVCSIEEMYNQIENYLGRSIER